MRAVPFLASRFADVVASVRCWPDARGWRRTGAELLWAVPAVVLVAHLGGLIEYREPRDPGSLVRLAAILLVARALGEELLFRAALIPRGAPRAPWIALSIVLFVLWHPLQALTVGPPWADAFLDPWFLAAVALLGLALARIYAATSSLWPSVMAHWAVVFVWKGFLGGPF